MIGVGAGRRWSAWRALVWESLRLSWRPVLSISLATGTLAAVYHRLLAPLGERRDAEVFSSLLVLMALVFAITLLACRDDGAAVGFEQRLFRLPLSTGSLVVARLAPALLLVCAMQAAVTWFMRAAFAAPWPFLGPLLLVVTVASWTLALSWSCDRRPLAIAPLGALLLVGLLSWLKPLLGADPLWARLAARDAAVLGLATVLAWLVAARGVANARRAGTVATTASRLGRRLTDPPRLRSATHGQLWMEWREKGRWVAFGALVWFAAAVVGSAAPAPETGDMLRQALHDYLPFAALMLPAVAGFFHGSFRLTQRVAGIDAFRATRPIADRPLAHALLRAAVRSCAAGWAATCVGMAAFAFGLWLFGEPARVVEVGREIAAAATGIGAARIALGIAFLFAAGWAGLGLVASIALCGRNWLSMLSFVVPLVVGSVILIGDFAGFDLLTRVGPALSLPLGLLFTLGAVAAWGAAVERRLIPGGAAILAALSWGATTILLLWLLPAAFDAPSGAGWTPPWFFAALGFASAVWLPPALAPLALRWNRHR